MAKYLIDSDIYSDFLQNGRFHNDIACLYAEHTPGLSFRIDFELIQHSRHFSLVVLE
jgi:hypothetical protein